MNDQRNVTWKKFPENIPLESGYYFVYYYNTEEKQNFYKALWWRKIPEDQLHMCHEDWHAHKGFWMFRIRPEVIAYIEESKNPYYLPCLQWTIDNLKKPYEDSTNN